MGASHGWWERPPQGRWGLQVGIQIPLGADPRSAAGWRRGKCGRCGGTAAEGEFCAECREAFRRLNTGGNRDADGRRGLGNGKGGAGNGGLKANLKAGRR